MLLYFYSLYIVNVVSKHAYIILIEKKRLCNYVTHMIGLSVLLGTLHILTYVFDWLCFTRCLTSFSSIKHLLHLRTQFLMLFHLTQMRFSQSTHLLMCLSLETLTSIIENGQPILVELIHLVYLL